MICFSSHKDREHCKIGSVGRSSISESVTGDKREKTEEINKLDV